MTNSTEQTPPNDPQLSTHQLANEVTDDPSVDSRESRPQTKSGSAGEPSRRVESRVARTVALVVLAAVVIGLIICAALFKETLLLWIGAVFVIPFLLLVSAPVWMAEVTKQAQDETVREQRSIS